MRRVILFFAAVLLTSVVWSQTMTVNFNDGSTVKYDMNKVKSIDFTSESSDNGNTENNDGNKSIEQLLVGTWKVIGHYTDNTLFVENGGLFKIADWGYLQFKADGHFISITKESSPQITKGTWGLIDDTIILQPESGLSNNELITNLESDKLSIKGPFDVILHYINFL